MALASVIRPPETVTVTVIVPYRSFTPVPVKDPLRRPVPPVAGGVVRGAAGVVAGAVPGGPPVRLGAALGTVVPGLADAGVEAPAEGCRPSPPGTGPGSVIGAVHVASQVGVWRVDAELRADEQGGTGDGTDDGCGGTAHCGLPGFRWRDSTWSELERVDVDLPPRYP